MVSSVGRDMLGDEPNRVMAVDASDRELGAVDLVSHKQVHSYVQHPTHFHINIKELQASSLVVFRLANLNDFVHLKVDNSTAYFYLSRQGGLLSRLNAPSSSCFDTIGTTISAFKWSGCPRTKILPIQHRGEGWTKTKFGYTPAFSTAREQGNKLRIKLASHTGHKSCNILWTCCGEAL